MAGCKRSALLGVACVCVLWLAPSGASATDSGTAAMRAEMRYLANGTYGGSPGFTGDVDRQNESPLTPLEPAGESLFSDLEVRGASGEFTCDNAYDVVSNEASGVAIGHCPKGTVLRRTKESVPNAQGIRFSGGYVQAPVYNGCGYLESPRITQSSTGVSSLCSAPYVAYGSFAAVLNSSHIGDGTGVHTTNSCIAYANVRPWAPALALTGVLGTVPAGGWVLWRYIVGVSPPETFKAAKGDFWVMVRVSDTAWTAGQSWVFVPYFGCFGARPYLPPGPSGYWHPSS